MLEPPPEKGLKSLKKFFVIRPVGNKSMCVRASWLNKVDQGSIYTQEERSPVFTCRRYDKKIVLLEQETFTGTGRGI